MLHLTPVRILEEFQAEVEASSSTDHIQQVRTESLLHLIIELRIINNLSDQYADDDHEDLSVKLAHEYGFVQVHLEQSQVRISLQRRLELFAKEFLKHAGILRRLNIFCRLHFEQHLQDALVELNASFDFVPMRNRLKGCNAVDGLFILLRFEYRADRDVFGRLQVGTEHHLVETIILHVLHDGDFLC